MKDYQEALFIGGEHDGAWIGIFLDQEVRNDSGLTYSGVIRSQRDAEQSKARYLRHDLPDDWPLRVVFVSREINLTKELVQSYLPRK